MPHDTQVKKRRYSSPTRIQSIVHTRSMCIEGAFGMCSAQCQFHHDFESDNLTRAEQEILSVASRTNHYVMNLRKTVDEVKDSVRYKQYTINCITKELSNIQELYKEKQTELLCVIDSNKLILDEQIRTSKEIEVYKNEIANLKSEIDKQAQKYTNVIKQHKSFTNKQYRKINKLRDTEEGLHEMIDKLEHRANQ